MTKAAVAIQVPLAPQTMRLAGVPFEDALWYARIPAGHHKARALRTPRGGRILNKIRELVRNTTAPEAMPLGV